MKRLRAPLMSFAACVLLAAPVYLSAQEQVSKLEDLIGVRGSSGENEMESRGYEYVGGEKSADSSYTYWREPKTDKCVAVRVSDGRYQSIVYAPAADCDRVGESAGGEAGQSGSADAKSFETVCGVIADGKSYSYRCKLRNEGCEGEGYCRTILTYPDNELRISWGKDGKIEVETEGMVPQESTSTLENGQTRFEMGGNTYFFYRNPDRAKKELARLGNQK